MQVHGGRPTVEPTVGPVGNSTDGRKGMKPRTVLVVVVAVILVVTWALSGLGIIDASYLFPSSAEDTPLVLADRLGDCREARRDAGDRCDPGADIEKITVWQADDRTLMAELELTETPDLGPALEWTVQFFADLENGVICGLSNAPSGVEPMSETVAYALDPTTKQPRGSEACDGVLEGSSARFSIGLAGQPSEAQFRLLGSVRLERPGDPNHPGSEDDFLIRSSLAELRG